MDANKKWMATGAIGCTFASLFAKKPELVGWKTIISPERFKVPTDALILSIQFPDGNKESVMQWALNNGFYLENIGEGNTGLRYRIGKDISWVQYLGLDSHVKTRQSPIPELMMCVKLPAKYYAKVGFNGILHLAHTSIDGLKSLKVDKLWETSFKNTAKRLGFKPTLKEAAKTTYNE